MRLFSTWTGFLGLLLALAGCGGGGGPDIVPPPGLNELFAGTYHTAGFAGTIGTPVEGTASWGTVVSDGAGMTTPAGQKWSNVSGSVSGPGSDTPAAYEVTADRQFVSTFGGSRFSLGGISADGSVVCSATVADGVSPAIGIAGKRSGTYSAASLTGPYHAVGIFFNPGVPARGALFGSLTFDGIGAGALTAASNVDGSISGATGQPLTFAVATDGGLTLDVSGVRLSGQVLAGGELVTLAGSTVDTGIPIMMLLVKGSSTATNATLNGTYHAVSLAIESSPTQWIATSARFTADGAGSLVLDAFTTNANGVITEVPAVGLARPYTVSPDGTFNPATGFLGGVSPSGNFAIFAGETTGAGAPEIWFMLR